MVIALVPTLSSRWLVTFLVVAMLVIAFGLIAFRGLTESDWLYGTYGRISQSQWERISELRDRLVGLGVAPEAVRALDDALLQPPPSSEDVLFHLRRAVAALEPYASTEIRAIQIELQALIVGIPSGYGPSPTPWSTPTPLPSPTPSPLMGAPVATTWELVCL